MVSSWDQGEARGASCMQAFALDQNWLGAPLELVGGSGDSRVHEPTRKSHGAARLRGPIPGYVNYCCGRGDSSMDIVQGASVTQLL